MKREKLPKPKYKAVIFDFDDTLVETRQIKFQHHRAVAKKFYNINITEETFLKHYGKPLNTLIKTLYQDSDTLENMIRANVSVRGDFLKKVYPGSVAVVKKLLDAGIKVGILTSTNKEFVLHDLKRIKFPINRLVLIQGPEETPFHKPDPRVFLPTLKKLAKEGIKKKDIVYVGDSMMDLDSAHGAGINFIAVTTGLYTYKDFKKHGARVIVKGIKDVAKEII